jgi:uncharacterized damage-inducible protein DinB
MISIDMLDQLLETWAIHNRVHLYMLDAIPEAALGAQLGGKGRSVAEQFAHVHNVRLMWLKSADPALFAGLEKLDAEAGWTTSRIAAALKASGAAVESLLRTALAPGGKVKGFKPHGAAFLGYLISHESHHRGQVGWTLKHAGHPLDKKTAFGLWEWGVR